MTPNPSPLTPAPKFPPIKQHFELGSQQDRTTPKERHQMKATAHFISQQQGSLGPTLIHGHQNKWVTYSPTPGTLGQVGKRIPGAGR